MFTDSITIIIFFGNVSIYNNSGEIFIHFLPLNMFILISVMN
jgi:hypothetical protein